MCRLAAFPPGTTRDFALDVMKSFGEWNKDGTGYAFVKDGEFIVRKWPVPYASIAGNPEMFDHMPYDGWTIAHVRASTHGKVSVENTHPFVMGDFCVCHNGVWSDHAPVRAVLEKYGHKFLGETDSEVAAGLIDAIGPEKFHKVGSGGVYLALHKDGRLWAVKTSGILEKIEHVWVEGVNSVILGSELKYKKSSSFHDGWARYNKDGSLDHKYEEPSTYSYGSYNSGYGGGYGTGYGVVTPAKPTVASSTVVTTPKGGMLYGYEFERTEYSLWDDYGVRETGDQAVTPTSGEWAVQQAKENRKKKRGRPRKEQADQGVIIGFADTEPDTKPAETASPELRLVVAPDEDDGYAV